MRNQEQLPETGKAPALVSDYSHAADSLSMSGLNPVAGTVLASFGTLYTGMRTVTGIYSARGE